MFVFGCGRCNMEGGDPEVMYHTLNKIGRSFDGKTRIRPGHDYGVCAHSTLDEQIAGNPFFLQKSKSDFVEYRMHGHNKRVTPYKSMRS
ncbi:MAG: MBL fold metallo-hydrolase, partial [Lentisphaeraceae bacterium]|nr:MBL fold metallo-hydrolase [Lentisphaeraceae bacterium]